jgi:hypothetical protein
VKALNYNGTQGTLTAMVGGATVAKELHSCSASIIGPTVIDDTTFVYTLDNPEAFSACTTNRWWFAGARFLQVGLQPDTATSVFTPATVTLNPEAGTSSAGLTLYFGCTTDLNPNNAVSTPVILPQATSEQQSEADPLQILRKEDEEELPDSGCCSEQPITLLL